VSDRIWGFASCLRDVSTVRIPNWFRVELETNLLKVLLINPPRYYDGNPFDEGIYVPVGLLSVAASARLHCDVRLYDCLMSDAIVETVGDAKVFGAPPERIKAQLEECRPDVVGIPIRSTAQSGPPCDLCELTKRILPEAKVVFGGADASVRFEHLLKVTSADACILGEGERSFAELLDRVGCGFDLSGIPGVAYRDNGGIRYQPPEWIANLDSLPTPAYDLIDMEAYMVDDNLYKNRGSLTGRSITVITSRGCPYNCVFCSIRNHMGRRVRCHSIDYVMKHLRHLQDTYGINQFHFEDDNISNNRERFEGLLDAIISEGMDIKWDTPNGIRADTLDRNILRKMKLAGCQEMSIAIESGNQQVLDKVIRKNAKLSTSIDVARQCNELGLAVNAFYVIGFPGETIQNMKDTIDLALELYKKHKIKPFILVATPLCGTELHDICIEHGYLEENVTDRDLAESTHLFGKHLINTPEFNARDIDSLARYYYRRFIINHPIEAIRRGVKRLLMNLNT